jgi:hypothetical protein
VPGNQHADAVANLIQISANYLGKPREWAYDPRIAGFARPASARETWMSSRPHRSTPMSWITTTIVLVVAGFACAFFLCEWIVGRRRRGPGGDDPTAAG